MGIAVNPTGAQQPVAISAPGTADKSDLGMGQRQKLANRFNGSPQKSKKNIESIISGHDSPDKFKIKDKMAITSFLQGFEYLTEDDLEILASYEEENYRMK